MQEQHKNPLMPFSQSHFILSSLSVSSPLSLSLLLSPSPYYYLPHFFPNHLIAIYSRDTSLPPNTTACIFLKHIISINTHRIIIKIKKLTQVICYLIPWTSFRCWKFYSNVHHSENENRSVEQIYSIVEIDLFLLK